MTTPSTTTSLIADIGATHARFQLCDRQGLQGAPVILQTAEYATAQAMLDELRQHQDLHQRVMDQVLDQVLFAVAGPQTRPDRITLTNTGLQFDAVALSQQLNAPVQLVNDFYALAHGVPYFAALTQIGGAEPQPGNKALLGPGSGLGMATLVPATEEPVWRVVSSEGGHADLAPGSPLEAELWSILAQLHDHVSWETVLCGPGLQNLYVAMCNLWGSTPQALTPAQISEQGQSMQDPVCHQTLESFCALLGSAAGNLALTVTAVGGIYIGGGIVPQMKEFVVSSPLRRRFEERGAMSDYVQQIPVYLVNDEAPGLLGAYRCLF